MGRSACRCITPLTRVRVSGSPKRLDGVAPFQRVSETALADSISAPCVATVYNEGRPDGAGDADDEGNDDRSPGTVASRLPRHVGVGSPRASKWHVGSRVGRG